MDWTLTIDSASSTTTTSETLSTPSELIEEKPEEPEEEELELTDVDELLETGETNFDASFTPFTLRWTYGRNINVPFVNLTSKDCKSIFYSAAHIGILYDYENKVMKFLQGHKNCITSISSDCYGKWIVTADSGKDSIIIVWNSETCLPTCTIFDPHGDDGTRLIGMSPDSKYLVSVSDAKDQIIACWKWTLGRKNPDGEFVLQSQYGKIHQIAFCKDKPEDFTLTAELCVLFGIWENDVLTVYLQEKPKRVGKLCCSIYQNYSHYALTATESGTLLLWSEVPFSSVYNTEVPLGNNKILLKTLRLDKESIQVIKSHKEVIVTGNISGELRFYDKMIRLLYWVQPFRLNSITEINFHLWYDESSDQVQKDDSCIISDKEDPFKPFHVLENAFQKVLEKEKEKLEELKLLLKDTNETEKTEKAEKKGEEEEEPFEESIVDRIVHDVLSEMEEWNIGETLNKRQFIEKIINATVEHVESKLCTALAHTQDLIEGFINSVFEEVDEEIPEEHAKDVAQSVMNEIMQSFDHRTFGDPDTEILIKDVLEDIIDGVGIVDEVMDAEVNDNENSKALTEKVVSNIFQVIEQKFAIDTQKIIELLVKNLMKEIEEQILPEADEGIDVEQEERPKLYCYLKKIINRKLEDVELHVPSDATLERKPFMIGDFMISTIAGDIGLINFLSNSYTRILEKCESPVTALDCHVGKHQFVVGNATGSVMLYNFLKTRNKILETHMCSNGEQCAVTSLKFAPSGYFLACGLANGTFWILDSSLLSPLPKSPHVHVDAPITQICISDDSLWIAHKDEAMRVCLYRCEDPSGSEIEFMGKQKSHFKPIRDLMFIRSLEEELHLFSLGEDRMLVEYDLAHSEADDLKILLIERIEQSAIPYCMTIYPKFGIENFILIANSEYKFKIFNDDSRLCRKTALGPRFEKPVSKFIILPKTSEKAIQYMVYACEKHIGIQMLPLDGNPYKSVGMIGHPVKVLHMDAYPRGRLLFTVGQDDPAILMWTINTRAVNIMAHIGGEGLNPYYCLIEGGQSGWLYKEIQDFFYYAQILHDGENTTSERSVSHEIPLCEVPDLMRAIGYFPSEHEIGNMLHEIQFWTYSDNGKPQKYISFEEFVKLYLNHQPAFGTPFSKLKESFETFADDRDEDDPIMWRETLTSMLQERAECLSQEQVVKYLQVLLPSGQEEAGGSSSSSRSCSNDSVYNFIPEEISYKAFIKDILGIHSPDEQEKAAKCKIPKEKGTEEEEELFPEDEEDKTEEENECFDDFD